MIKSVNKILSLLDIKEKKQIITVLFLIITVGLIDVVGLASVMPFVAAVSNHEIINSNKYAQIIYSFFDFKNYNYFILFLGLLVLSTLIVSSIIKSISLYFELKFVHSVLYRMSTTLVRSYVNQNYTFFLNHNTSVLSKNILQEVSKLAHEVVRPSIQILSKMTIVTFIVIFLFAVNPILASVILLTIGCIYYLLYRFFQNKLKKIGQERFDANEKRAKIINDIFGGIKEIKVLNRQNYFIDEFGTQARIAENKMVHHGLISSLPSYIMEVLAFLGILIIVFFYMFLQNNLENAIPIISLYAFASYRMMPAMQNIYSATSLLKFNYRVLEKICEDIDDISAFDFGYENSLDVVEFQKFLKLNSVKFTYPLSSNPVILNLNLIVKKHDCVGIVGSTGSGKTTIADIILGLLLPDQGSLEVDGVIINSKTLSVWQKKIGYVPQYIYLADKSVAENIALGVSFDQIDMNSVYNAAKISNIHNFVMNLPQQYSTIVGDRGVRLSGGQKQRIGIARALYHNPEILIFDEATSALDGATENIVIEALTNLSGRKTLIVIAHRLTTLKDCSCIYIVENGHIIESGSYSHLVQNSIKFNELGNEKNANL